VGRNAGELVFVQSVSGCGVGHFLSCGCSHFLVWSVVGACGLCKQLPMPNSSTSAVIAVPQLPVCMVSTGRCIATVQHTMPCGVYLGVVSSHCTAALAAAMECSRLASAVRMCSLHMVAIGLCCFVPCWSVNMGRR
jgi:hypothetical protein